MNKIQNIYDKDFLTEIRHIVDLARQKAYSAINSAMVEAYWQIGKRIVEQEQQGKDRADYGTQLIKSLSEDLTKEYGKGFSVNSLYYFRQFYLAFPEKLPTAWGILTWSHYKRLLSVTNQEARSWYLKEASEQMWSYRTLDRNISSQYYERLLLSQHKDVVESEMKALTAPFEHDKMEFIKNPTVAEFIGLSPNRDFTESELEGAIIDNLQSFLLELGKGFSFVARQKLVRTEKKDYFIDLVFYNYILKSFVLIDLKTTTITHQDVGQMDMYVRMYDEKVRGKDDNPTIGIVLCSETDNDIARYSVLHDNDRLFASKYMLYMPTEEELRTEIERQKEFFRLQHGEKLSGVNMIPYHPTCKAIKNHRFVLEQEGNNVLIVIGLNPSTADETQPDPTMKCVLRIVEANGYDGFVMLNLSSERCTNPKNLSPQLDERMNHTNQLMISKYARKYPTADVLVAFGNNITCKEYLSRNFKYFYDTLGDGRKWLRIGGAKGITSLGHPRHPLYCNVKDALEPFDVSTYIKRLTDAYNVSSL